MHSIVIADSNVKNAELIMNSLANRDYSIMISNTGINALSKVRILNPDILICSSNLNDMSSYDLCRTIKKDKVMSECLILFIDINLTNQSRIKALESGVDDFVNLELDFFILNAKVTSLLRVKKLSNQLKEKYRELEEKNKLLDMQLEMARHVQSSLIKEIKIEAPNIKISSKYLPAYAIGGDFYDIIQINKNLIFLIIGDVSGHGISSALLTTMIKIMIRNLSEYYTNPSKLLQKLNNQFTEVFENSGPDIYTCALSALIDMESKIIYYSNAGLTPPIYADYSSKTCFELPISGVPIGMLEQVDYELKYIKYEPGDLILFHTDGLSDLFFKENPEGFGMAIKNLIIESIEKGNISEIIENIILEFRDDKLKESEKLEMDDVSIVLCRLL